MKVLEKKRNMIRSIKHERDKMTIGRIIFEDVPSLSCSSSLSKIRHMAVAASKNPPVAPKFIIEIMKNPFTFWSKLLVLTFEDSLLGCIFRFFVGLECLPDDHKDGEPPDKS